MVKIIKEKENEKKNKKNSMREVKEIKIFQTIIVFQKKQERERDRKKTINMLILDYYIKTYFIFCLFSFKKY